MNAFYSFIILRGRPRIEGLLLPRRIRRARSDFFVLFALFVFFVVQKRVEMGASYFRTVSKDRQKWLNWLFEAKKRYGLIILSQRRGWPAPTDSHERSERMRTNSMLQRLQRPQFFCLLMVICMMLTITNTASAADINPEIPLMVKGVEGEFALYHTIKVQVENLEKWVGQPGHDPSKFTLYVDGNAFNGLSPSLIDNNTKLQFDLKRTPESKDAWTAVLSRGPRDFSRNVPVTVRQEGVKVQGEAMASLIVINLFWFKIFVGCFTAAIALFWWLAYRSDIIRDPGPQPKGNNKEGKPNRKPYSLARTQMAFWFFIVIIAYVFIWMVTSDLSNLTPSVLGLIGISAATGLSAAIVDSSKRSDQENQRRILEEKATSDEVEAEKLRSKISTLNSAINATPPPADMADQKAAMAAKQAELAAKQKEIEHTNTKIQEIADATQPTASKRFIDDILSDDEGVSFHRFQIFAWTIVLIFIFIASVYNALAMPDFDATLLALMGISGGTYIGFKLPDQQG